MCFPWGKSEFKKPSPGRRRSRARLQGRGFGAYIGEWPPKANWPPRKAGVTTTATVDNWWEETAHAGRGRRVHRRGNRQELRFGLAAGRPAADRLFRRYDPRLDVPPRRS